MEREEKKSEGRRRSVAESNQPRKIWPFGRIVSTHPGQDGMVRAVTLRIQYGSTRDQSHKLCFLEEEET